MRRQGSVDCAPEMTFTRRVSERRPRTIATIVDPRWCGPWIEHLTNALDRARFHLAVGLLLTRRLEDDQSGGERPYLVERVGEHLGAVSKTESTPSVRDFTQSSDQCRHAGPVLDLQLGEIDTGGCDPTSCRWIPNGIRRITRGHRPALAPLEWTRSPARRGNRSCSRPPASWANSTGPHRASRRDWPGCP